MNVPGRERLAGWIVDLDLPRDQAALIHLDLGVAPRLGRARHRFILSSKLGVEDGDKLVGRGCLEGTEQ